MNRPLAGISILFGLGILVAKHINIPFFYVYLVTGASLILSFLWLKKGRLFSILLSMSIFSLGGLFYLNAQRQGLEHIINFTPQEPKLVYLKGIIIDHPLTTITSYGERRSTFILKAERLKIEEKWLKSKGLVKVTAYARARFNYGDRLLLGGSLFRPTLASNPGGFNYREYLANKRIYSCLSVKKHGLVEILKRDCGFPLKRFAFRAKDRMSEIIQSNLSQPQAALLSAIILGDRHQIPEELNDNFIKSGTIHILAISGLHVGIVAFILLAFLKGMHVPRKFRYLLTMLLLTMYCILTGSRPSVVRATIMALVLFGGLSLNRDIDLYNSLGIAALIILLNNPLQLFDVGFQLSFIAVISIIYFTGRIDKLIFAPIQFPSMVRHFLISPLCVSLGAWLGVMPVVVRYFNIISPVTILANLMVVPLMSVILTLGFTFILGGLISAPLAKILGVILEFFLKLIINVTSNLSEVFGSYFYAASPPLASIVGFYCVIFLLFNYKRLRVSGRRLFILILITLNLFIWKEVLRPPQENLKVTFFDVGYGDSAFIQFPYVGANMLIDAGKGQDEDKGRWVIMPFLRSKGINRLDCVVISHPDSDHIGGMYTVLKNFKVRNVFDNDMPAGSLAYRNYRKVLNEERIPRLILRGNSRIEEFDKVEICVLHPPDELLKNTRSDTNNNSIVLKVIYKDIDFLFCGDVEAPAMERLLSYVEILNSKILKVPHHGAFGGQQQEVLFFNAVRPKVAVISASRVGRPNLPSSRLLKLFDKLGTKVYSTGQHGAISITTDGKDYSIQPMK